MAEPTSKASIDANFSSRLYDLKEQAAAEAVARAEGQQVKWARPQLWNADLFDFEEMSTPFDRTQANADFIKAVENPKEPGTVGDIIATTTMIDELSAMERAFRVRHTMRRPRAMAHLSGRKRGHGDALGPLVQLGVEYILGVIKQSSTK